MSRSPIALCSTAALMLAFAACSRPEPPDKDQPPEPQAPQATAKPSRSPPATQLRDYMQAPINKAKTAETTVLDAGKQQAADIEAQTSGNAPTPPPEQ